MPDSETQDDGCIATTFERKYYQLPGVFIKRSLRPREFKTGYHGLHVPPLGVERLKNEASCLEFIQAHTDIPVPRVLAHFMDDGAYYVITEHVDGPRMSELQEDQKIVVKAELERHLETLRSLKSDTLGGPAGIVVPPYRVLEHCKTTRWKLKPADAKEYIFCHNDLSQQNVIVDEESLRIKAIIDWEYAGFFPSQFEMPFYNRLGPSAAIDGEKDDSLELLDYLQSRQATT